MAFTNTSALGSLLWDSGVVAAGAAIDSPVLDTTDATDLYVVADNSAGAATRNITIDTLLPDGLAVIDSGLVLRTVAAGAKERGTVGPTNSGALGTPALNFSYPCTIPTRVRFHLVAGGAANGRLTIWRR